MIMYEKPTPTERLSKRESQRLKARAKRDAVQRAGQMFWDDVMGRTYQPMKPMGRKVKNRPRLEVED